MRKIMLFMVTLMLILMSSCGKSESQFDKELNKAYAVMEKTRFSSALMCDKISSTWNKAIFDNRTPSGKYCSDFNDALTELFDNFSESGITDSIKNWNNEMQKLTSQMNDAPHSRKDCYNDFVDIVSEVSSFSRMATSPSGNLRSYNEQTTSTFENISKKIDQFKIKYDTFMKK